MTHFNDRLPRHLAAAALAHLLLATLTTQAAHAGGGQGGAAVSTGGAGGNDSPTGTGANGAIGNAGGGGGGGAGITGGSGGQTNVAGGTGGTAAVGGIGGNGGNGSDYIGGGGLNAHAAGGGGGAHGFVGAGSPTQATTGGNGGNGGSATSGTHGGGGGGAGGYGAVVTGTSGAINFAATGGNGGNGGNSVSKGGGNGGSGGYGVLFTASGSFSVDAAVSGGAGGAGGTGAVLPSSGGDGAGGVGIRATGSADLTLGSNAVVTGGLSGDGVTQANAITLTGAVNRLALYGGASIVGNVVASGTSTLALGGTAAGTFDASTLGPAAQFRGFSSLVKDGTSAWTLTGTSSFTGAGVVDAGRLSVDGDVSQLSSLTVNAYGTLGGSGTVGNTVINGGTLAPGSATGTLSVSGNLAFTSASTYLVDVTPASAARVNVSGTAALAGATVNASFANGSYITKQYTILNATGGVSGTFGSQVNTNLPANFTSKLSYDANNAYLDLTLNFVSTPTPDPTPATPSAPTFGNGLSSNQNAVGNTLVNYFNNNGGIPLAFGALTPAGLTQASGETTAGTQQPGFTAATQFVGTMSDPTVAGRGGNVSGPMAYAEESDVMNAYASTGRKRSGAERDAYAMITKAAPRMPSFVPRWNVWASGFGGTQTTDGNVASGTNTSSSRIGGVAVGADYWLSPETVAGFALAGGATTYSVAGGGGGRSDLFQFGGFVRHAIGASYITASAAYGWQSVNTDRAVGGEQLRAQFDTNSYTARLEGGHRFATSWLGGIGVTPYAAAQVTYLDLPAYAESAASGSGTFALAYAAKGITAPRTELGLRSDKSFAIEDKALILRGRAAWAHDTNTERSASATFQSLPGASFVVNGARPAADAALTTVESELRFASGISVGATFEGEFSDVTRSYAGKGVVRYVW